jgi:signal transduction histidine kinase
VTPSLRGRILIGSILWTIGMIVLASAAFTILMEESANARMVISGHVFNVHERLRAPLTLAIGTICLVAGVLQVRRGLAPVGNLRARLAGVHQGHDRRLDGEYPSEVQPLVNDLNALLDTRERAIARAVGKAGDLAHGLKTPLAILAQDAEQASRAGQTELAASIRQQVMRMQRQVDYHLAHARAAASGSAPGARSAIVESADGLKRAMLRLHAERGLTIDIDVPADCTARVQREDLDEMLGNLLDNACKWARSRVVVSAGAAPRGVVIAVDDDGGGLADGMREAVLKRGVRADEAAPGSGLGLAIVRELSELYGGSIALERSPEGGLRATLTLPV